MSDNRKYYYLKLKETYFTDDSIVLLETMQDGILYSNILLKLYLKSLKYGGKLQLDEHIPYTEQMIATLTRHQIGTVERALQIFEQLGLVEQLPDGAYYMSNIELLIGQSSTEGERKKKARNEIKQQILLRGQTSTTMVDICPPFVHRDENTIKTQENIAFSQENDGVDICPPEIEIELEKEIELKKERELKNGQPSHFLGKYQNVSLSVVDLQALKSEIPNIYQDYIERLSEYMESTGKKYKSHLATIRLWAKKDAEKNGNKQNSGTRNYEYDGDKSL